MKAFINKNVSSFADLELLIAQPGVVVGGLLTEYFIIYYSYHYWKDQPVSALCLSRVAYEQ